MNGVGVYTFYGPKHIVFLGGFLEGRPHGFGKLALF